MGGTSSSSSQRQKQSQSRRQQPQNSVVMVDDGIGNNNNSDLHEDCYLRPKKIVFDFGGCNSSNSNNYNILDRIYYAETNLCDELTASDTYVLEFKDYGKQFIVRNKLSPDSYIQMSIMLAYYKLYGK